MIKETTFNLAFGRGGVDVTSQRPVDWSGGAGTYSPESGASGGAQFSYHRNHIHPSYIQDCVPTENGYSSVAWRETSLCTSVKVGDTRLSVDTGCVDSSCLRAWNECEFIDVTETRTGTKYLTVSGDVFEPVGVCAGTHKLNGINAELAVGLLEFNGRLIVFTEDSLFLESATIPYLFTPSLADQAQAFSLKYKLGRIVELVHSGDYLYVLGSEGGAVGQCSGDAELPITFKFLENFDGIMRKQNVRVYHQGTSIYVWSRGGLGHFNRGGFTPIDPDISQRLAVHVRLSLHPVYGGQLKPRLNDNTQVRDRLCDELHSNLFTELEGEGEVNDLEVYTFSSRLYGVSYARVSGAWTRLLLVDTVLERSSVLHVAHTTAYRGPTHEELLIVTPDGKIKELQKGKGTGYILFANNFRSSGRVIKVPRLNLQGRFNLEAYDRSPPKSAGAFEAPAKPLDAYAEVWSSIGHDVNATNNTRTLTRTYTDPHTLQYTGMLIGNYVTLLIPFSGFINTIKAQRA